MERDSEKACGDLGGRERGPLTDDRHQPPDERVRLNAEPVGTHADVGQDAGRRLSYQEYQERDVAEDVASTSAPAQIPSPTSQRRKSVPEPQSEQLHRWQCSQGRCQRLDLDQAVRGILADYTRACAEIPLPTWAKSSIP